MADPFLCQITMFAGSFAPRGWALCEGQLLPINQNQALFSLLGTTYGGDGRTTFALPDLRGRSPMHFGQGTDLSDRPRGESSGQAFVTLTTNELPPHNHITGNIRVSSATGEESSPVGSYLASNSQSFAEEATPNAFLAGGSSTNTGGSQEHENRQPYLAINFIIALQGVFPSRS